jgi:hypothetical protein
LQADAQQVVMVRRVREKANQQLFFHDARDVRFLSGFCCILSGI